MYVALHMQSCSFSLALPELKKARKKTLDGFKDYLAKTRGKLSKNKVLRHRDKWIGSSHADGLEPYCMIVVYYLEKNSYL